jgi:hypothetical protein
MQNLAQYALPMRAAGGMMPWALGAQAIGGLMTFASNHMEDGFAKNALNYGGNLLSNGGALVNDLALTTSTLGANKLLEGGFELFRLFGTEQGQRQRHNIGLSHSLLNVLTNVSGLKTIGKILGTDAFESFDY